ncbi:hypothetical protein HPB49_004037 [Dermacentor silvarum]|uniref:Uncharacterized protein n=1 Tax=Dermacentor silvarum TaxID=543639 RepID=A0ACB8DV24_DERSI|nr:uncharacterized protein LOC119437424 isoform X1 [Dermacentor silvarum]KAH7977954.1 hypothetical protein HPB49_004037 [Dermacentor silvarum]
MVEFTHDVESELIALVEERPCLWNSKDIHYHNRHVKEMAMREITEQLGAGFTESMVKSKWANLRSQFQREVRKIKDSAQGGHPLDRYVPKWAHYQQLQFLRQDDTPEPFNYTPAELQHDNSMDHSLSDIHPPCEPAPPPGHSPVPLKRKCYSDNGVGVGGAGTSSTSSFQLGRYRRESPPEDPCGSTATVAPPSVGACRAFGLMMENCVSDIPEGPNRDLAMLVAYQALVRFKLTLNGHGSDAVDITLSELFRS